ncbi:primosomal protein N priA (replication factor Y) [Mycobacterium tuberculosis]|nr:primosomal protein N priA (replication factor Y) [Mycobacterium tuberculosis]
MLSVPHLDRDFDYLVPAEHSDDAQPGVRVRVRFHGRLVDGFVLERRSDSDHHGKLGWLDRVVSPEPVLTTEIRRLVDAVAARYAGTRQDVLRLAVPARHARVEREITTAPGRPVVAPVDPSGWAAYGRGRQFLAALADSRAARAVWQALPGELWADRFAEAAAQTVRAGRTVLAIVPDQRDLDTLWQAATALVDEHSVVALSAGLGPEARYRRWLAALRGSARLVIGTRSAVFAPLSELGLVMVWADADDSLAEPRAPYPHAREVAMLRAHQARCAALIGGYARTAEAPRWCVAAGRTTWLHPGRRCVHALLAWLPSTTADTTTRETRPPAPHGYRPSRCAPRAQRCSPGRRCWCRCRGAGTSPRWPAGAAGRSLVAGRARVRYRCKAPARPVRYVAGVDGWTRHCDACAVGRTWCVPWWWGPGALPKSSAGHSRVRR